MIEDGKNGFLFPGGDAPALGVRLRELLNDPALRRRMGDNGYARAHRELNEQVYVQEFTGMIHATLDEKSR
jgi:glycosyltransferase involved in cell wall biosynthesis